MEDSSVAVLDEAEVEETHHTTRRTAETEYELHEHTTDDSFSTTSAEAATVLSSTLSSVSAAGMSEQVLVEKALLARIEFLEVDNKDLKLKLSKPAKRTLSVEDVAGNDNLVRL